MDEVVIVSESAADAELIRFVSGVDAFCICAGYFLDRRNGGGGSDQRGGAGAVGAAHRGRSHPRPYFSSPASFRK